jgi:hypothetical protein
MRNSTSQMDAAVVQPVVFPILLVRLNFDSGVAAWSSSLSPIDFEDVEYVAGGTLCSVPQVSESPGTAASVMSVGLSGVKSEIVALLLSEPYMGRTATVHLALTDEDMVFDPLRCKLIFTGKMDSISGNMGATASFSVAIKSRLADWERARNLMYTDSDQQAQYPGDRFFEYIPQISKMKIMWPKAQALPDPRD